LGLEAQRVAVENYLNGGKWKLIKEFVEVESGRRSDRPKLAEALAMCRAHREGSLDYLRQWGPRLELLEHH
jgi:DNA invertase Pin-like site-specific DNA recombinase